MNTQNISTYTSNDIEALPLGTRLLRRKEVELKTGKSRSAIYVEIQNGTFPAPVFIGVNSVAWVEAEIDQWIAERIANRDARLGEAARGIHQKGANGRT